MYLTSIYVSQIYQYCFQFDLTVGILFVFFNLKFIWIILINVFICLISLLRFSRHDHIFM